MSLHRKQSEHLTESNVPQDNPPMCQPQWVPRCKKALQRWPASHISYHFTSFLLDLSYSKNLILVYHFNLERKIEISIIFYNFRLFFIQKIVLCIRAENGWQLIYVIFFTFSISLLKYIFRFYFMGAIFHCDKTED